MPSPSTNPPKPPKAQEPPVATVVPSVHPRRLSPSEGWFAPHAPKHKRRHHRRRKKVKLLKRFIMPTIVMLLGVATACAAFKMYVLDRRNKPKPTQSAANAAKNFALLDAEMYGYENALVQNRTSLMNLYGDGLILDSSIVVNTYSNRLSPEVREAMRRTNFNLNAHMTQPADSTNLTTDVMLDPMVLIRSRTNRPKVTVDTSGEIVRVAIGEDRWTSSASPMQVARYQSKPVERPSAPMMDSKPTPSGPRFTTTSSIAATGTDRAAPPSPQLLFTKASRLYTSGDFKGAEAMCVKLKQEAPGLKGLSNLLGEIYSRQRRWDDAVKEFESAIKEDDNNAEYHNNLGLVLSQLNKDEPAEVHLEKAQKLDPMNATIMMNYAWHFRKTKRYQEALKYLDLALVIDGNNAQAKNKRIQTLLDLQRYADVQEIVKGQIAANPRDAQALLMMAVLHTRQGDAKGAVEWLQKAEPIATRTTLLAMLEKINDFDSIKNTTEYKDFVSSLKSVP